MTPELSLSMILRELYKFWSDRSEPERRSQYPGPFLLVNWPLESSVWNRLLIPVVDGQNPDKEEYLIGRVQSCDIAIREAGISSRHALLQRTTDEQSTAWRLADLSSTNGTYTRRKRVLPGESERLENNQMFLLGTEAQVNFLTFEGLQQMFETEDPGEKPSGTISTRPVGEDTQTVEPEQLKNMLLSQKVVTSAPHRLPQINSKPWDSEANNPETNSPLGVPLSSHRRSYWLTVEGYDPVELSASKTRTIGRSPKNDIRLNHPLVSRRHVRVTVEREAICVEDLGSSNGTIVGTSEITACKVPLDASKCFWIGPFCLRVVEEKPAAKNSHASFSTQLRLKLDQKHSAGITMSGSISAEQTVAELFQGIEFNGKSGTLFVEGQARQGLVSFRKGRPQFAQSHGEGGVRVGEEALYKLLAVNDGEFHFGRQIDDSEAILTLTVTAALVEFSRRQDEQQRGID